MMTKILLVSFLENLVVIYFSNIYSKVILNKRNRARFGPDAISDGDEKPWWFLGGVAKMKAQRDVVPEGGQR
jgi:hypothetical protein